MTADAGGVGAPRFDVVLRGYDRRQVDEHVARLQRVMSRMRADLELVRSQPIPVVQGPPPGFGRPGRPPGAPRPAPRPRPDEPDMIGSFTDRMQSILQAAEEEAAEIRSKARAGARAETESVRAELADLVRQRDAVLHELTRMRGQLGGMLHAPTGRMPSAPRDGANPRQATGDPAPAPGGARPGTERPVSSANPPKPRPNPAPSPKPPGQQQGGAQPGTAQPGRPQSASAQSGPPSSGTPSSSPSASPAPARPGPAAVAPGRAPRSAGSPPASGQPLSGPPMSGPKAPPNQQAPAGQNGSPQKGSGQSGSVQNPSARNPSAQNGATSAGQQGGAARGSDTVASPVSTNGDAGRPSDVAKQAKAAHRLPTGAYPAVGEQPSMRPRTEPEPEPGDLFRPTAQPGRDAAAAKKPPAKPGDVEATMQVSTVRPASSDATAPAVTPPVKKSTSGAKGTDGDGPAGGGETPDRSTTTSRSG